MIKNTNFIQANNVLFGSSLGKNGAIDSYLDFINEGFELSLSYYQITKNEDYTTTFDAWIIDEKSYDADISKKKILMKPNQDLSQGEIINWENKKWLCTKIDQQNTYYNDGLIEFCNYELKWVNLDGKIQSAWGVLEAKKLFTEGVQEQKYIITGNVEHRITLSRNNETLKIRRDDRFLISNNINNPIGYKVTKVDDSFKYGLVILNLQEQGAEVSPNDNAELMIADYYNRISSYSLSILNGSSLQVNIAQDLQLNIEVTKTQNSITTILSPTPSITYFSSDTTVATINSSGLVHFLKTGTVNITASLASNVTISDSITLTGISVPQDNFTYTLTGNVTNDSEIKMGSTVIFTGKKFNNGIQDNTAIFNFSIVSGSTPVSAYTFVGSLSSNTCSIKCNNYTFYINLKMIDSVSGFETIKQVKLRGII